MELSQIGNGNDDSKPPSVERLQLVDSSIYILCMLPRSLESLSRSLHHAACYQCSLGQLQKKSKMPTYHSHPVKWLGWWLFASEFACVQEHIIWKRMTAFVWQIRILLFANTVGLLLVIVLLGFHLTQNAGTFQTSTQQDLRSFEAHIAEQDFVVSIEHFNTTRLNGQCNWLREVFGRIILIFSAIAFGCLHMQAFTLSFHIATQENTRRERISSITG